MTRYNFGRHLGWAEKNLAWLGSTPWPGGPGLSSSADSVKHLLTVKNGCNIFTQSYAIHSDGKLLLKFRKRSYTDTSNFTLRCGVCQIGVKGQKVCSRSFFFVFDPFLSWNFGRVMVDDFRCRRLWSMLKQPAMLTFKSTDNVSQMVSVVLYSVMKNWKHDIWVGPYFVQFL